jgi:hypothetical protein
MIKVVRISLECGFNLWLVIFLFCSVASAEWFWTNPLPQGRKLNDVWAEPGGAVWVVGNYGTILRRSEDGHSTFYESGTNYDLKGIWGTGTDDIFAVGGSYYEEVEGVRLH